MRINLSQFECIKCDVILMSHVRTCVFIQGVTEKHLRWFPIIFECKVHTNKRKE